MRPTVEELKVATVREALDVSEGGSLLVDPAELQALESCRVHGLPARFAARRVRGDCVLIGWQDLCGTWALRLNNCTIKERFVEMLEGKTPV